MTYITIPGFEDLTEQEVFVSSLFFIRSTGKPGVSAHGSCSYERGCAASIFLTEAARLGTGAGWLTLFERGEVPEVHYKLVLAIQRAHDGAAREAIRQLTMRAAPSELNNLFMILFEQNMRIVAKTHNLEYKEPNK